MSSHSFTFPDSVELGGIKSQHHFYKQKVKFYLARLDTEMEI